MIKSIFTAFKSIFTAALPVIRPSWALAILVGLFLPSDQTFCQESETREAETEETTQKKRPHAHLSDDELRQELAILSADLARKHVFFEEMLPEVLLRDDRESFEPFLKEQIESIEDSQYPLSEDSAGHHYPGTLYVLPAVTTLRRLQGKDDPIKLSIDRLDEIDLTADELPTITVNINNTDKEHSKFSIYQLRPPGYWPHRWKVQVFDSEGNQLPEKKLGQWKGSMVRKVFLTEGAGLSQELKLSDFVDITQPGKYKLKLFFTNVYPIANESENEFPPSIFVYESEEFDFTAK